MLFAEGDQTNNTVWGTVIGSVITSVFYGIGYVVVVWRRGKKEARDDTLNEFRESFKRVREEMTEAKEEAKGLKEEVKGLKKEVEGCREDRDDVKADYDRAVNRIEILENALDDAKIPYRKWNKQGTDTHRPITERRKGPNPDYKGSMRRRDDPKEGDA